MNKKLTIGGGIILLVIAYLFWSGMNNSSVYFLEVSEFYDQQEQFIGKGTRINGKIVPGSIQWNAQELLLTFQITDGSKTMDVRYKGVAPDTFTEDLSVVVEGKYESNVFLATQIMTKCPSKYEAKRE